MPFSVASMARSQHAVRELSGLLEDNGCDVKYAIHPVAGRMPGHMVAIVTGANDVVNPAARHDKSSPIYGMPIINADKAKTVFVLKRSMATGFACI